MLKDFPSLVVIGAHFGGWSVWDEAVKTLAKYENFYVDCSSTLYAHTPTEAKALIDAYGAHRVLFGTDYPMWLPESEIEMFMHIPLEEDERINILSKNASALFDIK